MRRNAWLILTIGAVLPGRTEAVRYLHWDEIQPAFAAFAAAGQRAPTFSDVEQFDEWIRQRDGEVRGRINRGVEDSIAALVLSGSSFTTLPKIASAADAVNAAGDLTPGVRSRVQAFVQGIEEQDQERFTLTRDFLQIERIPDEEVRAFVIGIVRRYALEQAGFQKKHPQAPPRLDGGIGPETSLTANFAIEDSLAYLKSKGALQMPIHRVAVIGPGLDFAGKAGDAFPPQSVQPFAILDSVLHLGLTQPAEVEVTSFDLNPAVLSYLKSLPARIHGGHYALQLPRQAPAGWNPGATAYWQHFGESIGKAAEPHAITVKSNVHIVGEQLNIVAQTREFSAGQDFDLVIATNVFGYYNPFEQTMALANIAQMMSIGGIVLVNNPVPTDKLQALEFLGARHVVFADNGGSEDVLMFRRH